MSGSPLPATVAELSPRDAENVRARVSWDARRRGEDLTPAELDAQMQEALDETHAATEREDVDAAAAAAAVAAIRGM